MRLLLIEDEKKLSEALSYILKKEGYIVDVALDGETGLEMAMSEIYDLMVLDWLLPGIDGLEILREIRMQKISIPILLLTAKDGIKDRVEGLDAGADDYLVKPFSTEELFARLRAISRRKNKELLAEEKVTFQDLTLYPLKSVVMKGNEPITLTVKEKSLLELLIKNNGIVVTKERIYEKVWGYNAQSEFANVELYIFYLRKKLGTSYIKTVRGVGYYLGDK